MKVFCLTSVICSLLLAGCASQQEKPVGNIQLPEWIVSPKVENGFAETACVISSGNFDIDRKAALASARATLAQQIEIQVKAMDKTYARRVDAAGGTNTGAVFETASKQLTDQTLSGIRASKTDTFTISGKENLCVMATLQPDETKKLFDSLVRSSGQKLSSQDEAVLYEEFRAYKAQQELEQSLKQ